ncbi:MAG: TetR/AcrR family transcriptional regulator [Niabella sp.]
MAKTIVKRNKEKTKQKLINAVGKVLRKEGFQGVGVNKVADTAGVGKKLIYDYFQDMNGLIKAYLNQVDFWNQKQEGLQDEALGHISKDDIFSLLKDDFEYLNKSVEMQKIILWGISEKNKTINKLVEQREEFGEKVFAITDKDFKGSSVDFRAVNAIFVGAIYYMVLHAKTNDATMCGIDFNTGEGRKRIFDTMKQIFDWCYDKKAK